MLVISTLLLGGVLYNEYCFDTEVIAQHVRSYVYLVLIPYLFIWMSLEFFHVVHKKWQYQQ